jgi:hypothetical protein
MINYMKNWLVLMVLVLCSSCCDTYIEVTYKYEGTVIKRVDECGISTFYYGEISRKSPKVWTKYSGINDGFAGYLVFGKEGKVRLLSGDGYFQSENNGTNKFDYTRISYEDVPPGKGVYYIMLATNVERERNANTGSGVKVTYDD